MPNKIKISLKKCKLTDKELDNNNLYFFINDCINIKNDINNTNNIKLKLKKQIQII